MPAPYFQNQYQYDLDIPTINGGTAVIPSGKYVQGSYYLLLAAYLPHFVEVGGPVPLDEIEYIYPEVGIPSSDGGSGTITGVLAGAGLTGGGLSGTVSLAVATGGIVASMIASGTITAALIGSGQVVKSLNALKDTVNIIPGSSGNISVTVDGQNIEVDTVGSAIITASGILPITLDLDAGVLEASIAITPANDGGAVALQSSPVTSQGGYAALQGGLIVQETPDLGAPAVAPQGTSQASTYAYQINALVKGNRVPGATGLTNTGNSTLSPTNFNRLTWSAVPFATSYEIFRRNPSDSEFYLIGTSLTATFDDIGYVLLSQQPVLNATGFIGVNVTSNGSAIADQEGTFLRVKNTGTLKDLAWFEDNAGLVNTRILPDATISTTEILAITANISDALNVVGLAGFDVDGELVTVEGDILFERLVTLNPGASLTGVSATGTPVTLTANSLTHTALGFVATGPNNSVIRVNNQDFPTPSTVFELFGDGSFSSAGPAQFGGLVLPPVIVQVGNHNVTDYPGKMTFYLDNVLGAVTMVLPTLTSASKSGQLYLFMKTDGSQLNSAIAGAIGQPISGAAQVLLTTQGECALIQSYVSGSVQYWTRIRL